MLKSVYISAHFKFICFDIIQIQNFVARCMDNLECNGMDTRDTYGRDRFLPLQLEAHLTLGITVDTWWWDIHPSFYPIHKVTRLLKF